MTVLGLLATLVTASAPTPAEPAVSRCFSSGVVAPTPSRRLTRVEYAHSAQDLLGWEHPPPVDGLPADESLAGFAANSVSPPGRPLIEAYLEQAEAIAARSAPHLAIACPGQSSGSRSCVRQGIARLLLRAFRRTPEQAEVDRHLRLYDGERRATGDAADALRAVIAAVLSAPSFLYRDGAAALPGPPRPLPDFALATRLSFLLWSSGPDDELLHLAASGALARLPVLEAQARRLVRDPRALRTARSFHRQWLGLADRPDKSRSSYPAFGEGLWRSMLVEVDRFSEALLSDPDATFATLLAGRTSFVDDKLAALYGLPSPGQPGFVRVALGPERAGILTRAAFLTANAFPDQPSPIHRGKFVRENLLCQHVPDPPPGLDISPPVVDASKPTKERFEDHRLQGVCSSCHRMMDPIGFGFQHYDGIGRWRDRDGEHPVDAAGELGGTRDADGPFDGVPALVGRLVGSGDAQECQVRQWIRFALGRREQPGEDCAVAALARRFVASGLNLQELLVAVATSDLVRLQPTLGTGQAR